MTRFEELEREYGRLLTANTEAPSDLDTVGSVIILKYWLSQHSLFILFMLMILILSIEKH